MNTSRLVELSMKHMATAIRCLQEANACNRFIANHEIDVSAVVASLEEQISKIRDLSVSADWLDMYHEDVDHVLDSMKESGKDVGGVYVLFGSDPCRAYDENGVEGVEKYVDDGGTDYSLEAYSAFERGRQNMIQILEDMDGWDTYRLLSSIEYLRLSIKLNPTKYE